MTFPEEQIALPPRGLGNKPQCCALNEPPLTEGQITLFLSASAALEVR